MTVVVDASVAVKWFIDEGDSGVRAARSLLLANEELIAPTLLLGEIQNVLWKKLRVGQVSEDQGAAVAKSAPRFFTRLEGDERLIEKAWRIAVKHDHPIYDCLYLALALDAGASLATFDKKLKALARAAKVPLAEL